MKEEFKKELIEDISEEIIEILQEATEHNVREEVLNKLEDFKRSGSKMFRTHLSLHPSYKSTANCLYLSIK